MDGNTDHLHVIRSGVCFFRLFVQGREGFGVLVFYPAVTGFLLSSFCRRMYKHGGCFILGPKQRMEYGRARGSDGCRAWQKNYALRREEHQESLVAGNGNPNDIAGRGQP
jgi:hypothetical protein